METQRFFTVDLDFLSCQQILHEILTKIFLVYMNKVHVVFTIEAGKGADLLQEASFISPKSG